MTQSPGVYPGLLCRLQQAVRSYPWGLTEHLDLRLCLHTPTVVGLGLHGHCTHGLILRLHWLSLTTHAHRHDRKGILRLDWLLGLLLPRQLYVSRNRLTIGCHLRLRLELGR